MSAADRGRVYFEVSEFDKANGVTLKARVGVYDLDENGEFILKGQNIGGVAIHTINDYAKLIKAGLKTNDVKETAITVYTKDGFIKAELKGEDDAYANLYFEDGDKVVISYLVDKYGVGVGVAADGKDDRDQAVITVAVQDEPNGKYYESGKTSYVVNKGNVQKELLSDTNKYTNFPAWEGGYTSYDEDGEIWTLVYDKALTNVTGNLTVKATWVKGDLEGVARFGKTASTGNVPNTATK